MKITHTRPAQERSVSRSTATRERFLQKPFRPVFFRRETDRPFSNKEVTTLPWALNKFSGSERMGGTPNLAHRACPGGREGGAAAKRFEEDDQKPH